MNEQLLYDVEYEGGNKFIVFRMEKDNVITVVLKRKITKFPNVVAKVEYENVGEDFRSEYLSWYNVLFYSNYYGVSPDYKKMNYSVQEGDRLAATAQTKGKEESEKIISNLPNNCEAFYYLGNENIVYICRKGTLCDYFDYDSVKKRYEELGIWFVDWVKVKKMFEEPLSYFSNESNCGFNIQGCSGDENKIILGLLLGYPIESTASNINGKTKVEYRSIIAEEHFENSEEPFNDGHDTWVKYKDKVVQEWRLKE